VKSDKVTLRLHLRREKALHARLLTFLSQQIPNFDRLSDKAQKIKMAEYLFDLAIDKALSHQLDDIPTHSRRISNIPPLAETPDEDAVNATLLEKSSSPSDSLYGDSYPLTESTDKDSESPKLDQSTAYQNGLEEDDLLDSDPLRGLFAVE
tara:strand:- start:2438 stop:2890 length:453 start_codon:yes stop_codon:yes gene_type:complete